MIWSPRRICKNGHSGGQASRECRFKICYERYVDWANSFFSQHRMVCTLWRINYTRINAVHCCEMFMHCYGKADVFKKDRKRRWINRSRKTNWFSSKRTQAFQKETRVYFRKPVVIKSCSPKKEREDICYNETEIGGVKDHKMKWNVRRITNKDHW